MDRLQNGVILDKDPAQRVSTFCICASGWNSGNCGFSGLPLHSLKWQPGWCAYSWIWSWTSHRHWLSGPSFRKLPETEWPISESQSKPGGKLKPQKKQPKEKTVHENPTVNANTTAETDNPINHSQVSASELKVPENPILAHLLTRCSSFSKVRRTLAYVPRFIQNARRSKQTGAITVEELEKSEKLVFRWGQCQLDVNTLNKQINAKLGDDGLLREHGRLEDIRSLPSDMRNPMILPRNQPLAYLHLRHICTKLDDIVDANVWCTKKERNFG
jgi:hypothetical protein